MVVILCESFEAAFNSFTIFLSYLYNDCPEEVRKVYEHCYCVEMWDDLRYIFVDYRMEHAFDDMKPDIVDDFVFFDGMYEWFMMD